MEHLQHLFDLALNSRKQAYAPYSGFKVGAAILSDRLNYYFGCNVENASYPCGTCAEAGAISAMIAGGDSKIAEILIVADTDCIIPCGNCLQKILEFGDNNTIIHSANLNGITKTFTLKELSPNYFKAEDINNAR